MKLTREISSLKNVLLLTWCASCLIIYICVSARGSYTQNVDIFTAPLNLKYTTIFLSSKYWMDLARALLGVTVFALAYISLGIFITQILSINKAVEKNSRTSGLANIATCFLIGSSLYSINFLSFSSLYKLTPAIVVVSLTIGLASGLNQLISNNKSKRTQPIPIGSQDAFLPSLNTIIFIVTLLLTSARISYDSTAIYFSNAKITAYLGKIQYFTEDTFVASAFQNTIQYTAIMQVFGEQSARMFSWICGLVIIIFTLALAEKINISQKARLILISILLTSTAFIDLLGDGKVDLINSAISIAVVYWLVTSEAKKEFLLTGFLAGMSITGRPYNIFLLAVFIFLFYFQKTILQTRLSKNTIKNITTPLFWISLGAIPVGLFHLLANWTIQGHPLAFLNSLSHINPVTGPWDNKPETMLTLRLLYPLVATFRNTPQSLGNISPLVIGFAPFILLSAIRAKINFSLEIKILTASSVITLYLWIFLFFTVVELRYVFFLWFVLFVPTAQIIATVLESEARFFVITKRALIFVLLFFMLARTFIISTAAYSPIDQNSNPQCRGNILCKYLIAINKSAPPHERVLSLSAYRYYLRNDLFVCSSTHSDYDLLKQSAQQSVNSFWEEVIRQGYTYIAYEFEYTTRHLQFGVIPSPENTPSWLKLERLDHTNSNIVAAYKIYLDNPPVKAQYNCRENNKNILEVQLLP